LQLSFLLAEVIPCQGLFDTSKRKRQRGTKKVEESVRGNTLFNTMAADKDRWEESGPAHFEVIYPV